MIRVDHYTGEKRNYRQLTRAEVLALRGHALAISNSGDVVRVTINGKVRTWKRNPNRIEVPVKYGMYEYAVLGPERFVALE